MIASRVFPFALVLATTATVANAAVVGVWGDRYNLNVINDFYNSVPGASSSILTGQLDAINLSGTDMLWAVQPADAYTTAEINTMASFLSDGNRIAFMGEHGTFAPAENARITAALQALGSSIEIIPNVIVDPGFREATVDNGQIKSHPLTAGVDSYEYAAFDPLLVGSNAQVLMTGQDDPNSIMMAFENIGPGSVFVITDQNVWDNSSTNWGGLYDNGVLFTNLLFGQTQNPVVIPDLVKVSGDGQDIPTSTSFDPFVVRVTDQNGNPLSGMKVSWVQKTGDGNFVTAETVTDTNGEARAKLAPGLEYLYEVTAQIAATGETVTFEASLFNVFTDLTGLSQSDQSFAQALNSAFEGLQAIPESSRNAGQQDLFDLIEQLRRAPVAQVREAIDALTPKSVDLVVSSSIGLASDLGQDLVERMTRTRLGATGFDFQGLDVSMGDQSGGGGAIGALIQSLLGAATGGAASADEAGFERLGVFVNGHARLGNKNESSRSAGFDVSTVGITAGVDYRFMEGLVLGAAIGYGSSDTDLDRDAGGLDTETWTLSAYGTYYRTDNFYLEGSLSYAWDSYNQVRNIRYSLLNGTRQAEADFNGNVFSLMVGGGYDFFRGPGIFDVYGRLRYMNADIEGYREQGALGLDLRIDDQNATSFKSILGVQYSQAFSTPMAVLLPQAWLEWAHEFEDGGDEVNAFLANDPTQALFALATDSFDSDSFRLGVGLGAQFAKGRTAFVSYEAALGVRDYMEHRLSAGVRLSF